MISALPSATFDAYLQGAPTGLVGTVGVKITNASGSVITARTTSGIAEYVTGSYHKTLTAPASNGNYLVIWDASGTFVTEELRVGATTQQIADSIFTSTITVTTPVAANGDITVIRGDDYLAADGRALEWADSTWPDLTGSTVTFTSRCGDGNENLGLLKACSIVTPSGPGKRIRLELTNANTEAHIVDEYNFDIRAVLASGHKVTLVRSRLFAADEVAP